MKSIIFKTIGLILTCMVLILGCKNDFLDEKPNKSLMIPTTLSDFQSLLDHGLILNHTPFLALLSSDDIYTTDGGYLNFHMAQMKNSYTWQEDVYEGEDFVPDWSTIYEAIYYANTVLDGLEGFKSNANNRELAENLKGQALFFRAISHYHLNQQFAPPFENSTADSELGAPIRITADVKIASERKSLRESYLSIIDDLKVAITLLPTETLYKTRPRKDAAIALLARVYLTMGDYENSFIMADECIKSTKSRLLNYNLIENINSNPFPSVNKNQNEEIMFLSTMISLSVFTRPSQTFIDSSLVSLYHDDDLRKDLFFNRSIGGTTFKGNYSGTTALFTGLALDEVYLIRAEASARLGDIDDACNDLTFLMKNRWRENATSFRDYKANNEEDILKIILEERRKELVYRDLRWSDLRRLNLDSRFQKVLIRKINNQNFKLEPKSRRYTLPLPDLEIENSSIPQNKR